MKNIFIALSASIFILFSSCESEEVFPEISLLKISDVWSSYMNISFHDSTYHLKDSINNYYTTKTYVTSAHEDEPYPSWSGASFRNDSSIIDFSINNIFEWMSRNELLHAITKSNQELAYNTYENDRLNFKNYGFLVEINEYTVPMGGSKRHASDRCEQHSGSFNKISDYYAGDTERTIWLKGSFQVDIEYKNSIETLTGDFFMEFPLWFEEEC
jgi:hypothetical protein